MSGAPAAAGRRHLAAAVLSVATFFLLACGSDFQPVRFPTTGQPAQPLGQIMDLDVELPSLFVAEAGARGLRLDMHLFLPTAGPGTHEATYEIVASTAAGGLVVEIDDLGMGSTTVTLGPDTWITGRIGPLQTGTDLFEMMLTGTPTDAGRRVTGESLESQTNLPGTFTGWSRHRFLISVTDFSFAGKIAEVALTREREVRVRGSLGAVSSDPVLRRTGRSIFAINRLTFDNLQRLDPTLDFATAWQAGMGAGSNPHDIVDLGDGRGYVSRYEPPFNDVAVIDLTDGALLGSIPLASLAENIDGTPRADRIVEAGGIVFVALQDIDRTFSRFAEGKLAVLDPLQDAVVGVIPLGGKNPVDLEVRIGSDGRDRVWVALAGIFPGLQAQELSGGIVVVDVSNRIVERMALDDDAAGGNISALALVSDRLGYVVVSDASFSNRVLAFDPQTGAVLRTVFTSTDLIPDIAVDGAGVLAIPVRDFQAPALCLYRVPADPAQAEMALGCGALGLLPFSVEALD